MMDPRGAMQYPKCEARSAFSVTQRSPINRSNPTPFAPRPVGCLSTMRQPGPACLGWGPISAFHEHLAVQILQSSLQPKTTNVAPKYRNLPPETLILIDFSSPSRPFNPYSFHFPQKIHPFLWWFAKIATFILSCSRRLRLAAHDNSLCCRLGDQWWVPPRCLLVVCEMKS